MGMLGKIRLYLWIKVNSSEYPGLILSFFVCLIVCLFVCFRNESILLQSLEPAQITDLSFCLIIETSRVLLRLQSKWA